MNKDIPSEKIQQLLKAVFDDCMKEDTAVRERQIRKWRQLKLLWEGFQAWYDEVAHDWRIWDFESNLETDQADYNKPINVFKAYLESIIAALSVTVPPVKCFPDDADNPLDLATAKAGDKIAQLIYRHNDVVLLWLHSLFINVTEGMTACYSYPVEDEAYGTYTENKYEDVEENHQFSSCPNCGYNFEDNLVSPEQEEEKQDEFQPEEEPCPSCSEMVNPVNTTETFTVSKLVGITSKPKSRICMEVYGGLNVKIGNYAKTQKKVPYLIFSEEIDCSIAVEMYEDLHQHTKEFIDAAKSMAGAYTDYAQWGRLSPQYQGEYPQNVVTIHRAWIRPAKFNILNSKEDVNLLKKKYPKGVKVVYVNDKFAEACPEVLDDCWTLRENPLADYLHFEPLGQSLTSVQDITSDLISLILQTIEHGIGQTFADPAVLDFKSYQQTEATPGGIFPTKSISSSKSIKDGFHEMKTATLSAEVLPFGNLIQSMGQQVSGALPSLWGGNLGQGASETASQYSMSRAQALQRLQNTWKTHILWWKNIFGKVIPAYIKEVKEDERDVQRDDDGNFINVFIRKAELEGKIGRVELEANENLPLTWSQIKDTIEKLLTNANPEIAKILSAPENAALLHEFLGLEDFYIPGEDDIIKQYDEIKELLNSAPIETGDPENPEIASVEIDPDYDNHALEFEICRKWIISEAGRQTKTDNPAGYKNVLLHGKAHLAQMQMMQMQQMQQAQGAAPNAKPDTTKTKEAPITGESDVHQRV